jgi:hypothetical protein
MDYVPEQFKDAPIGEVQPSACTPALPAGFRGVLLAAPTVVRLQGDVVAVVPVCGRYSVAAAGAIGAAPMRVHVRRVADGEVMSAEVTDPDPVDEPELPRPTDVPPLPAEALKGVFVGGCFHVDVQAAITMPLRPGDYDIAVTFGGVTSEPVRVAIEN